MKLVSISASEQAAFYASFSGDKTFLQGAKYGTWRESIGEVNHRLGVFMDNALVGLAQCQMIAAKRGNILLCSHGPLLNDMTLLPDFLDTFTQFARAEKADLARISPLLPVETETVFEAGKWKKSAPYMVNPSRTLTVDAQLEKADLLAQMKKSTRYEMKQIEKAQIVVKQGGMELLNTFWDLHEKTVARQKFTPFAKGKTQKQLDIFGDDCQIFLAMIDNVPMAASLIVFDDAAGYYHQGSSVRDKRPIAHATLLAAIEESKKRGCTFFNFWGLSEAENKKHPWWGLSRFKRGFGGTEVEYAHAYDFPITWKYWLCHFVEKRRRKKRGYE